MTTSTGRGGHAGPRQGGPVTAPHPRGGRPLPDAGPPSGTHREDRMQIDVAALRLYPYRLRPGVHDADTRDGRLLMALYAWAPNAADAPGVCGVRTDPSRRPVVLLADGRKVEWSPKAAAQRWAAEVEPCRAAQEAAAYRVACAPQIKAAKAGHSASGDWNAWVAWKRPDFTGLVAEWLERTQPEWGDDGGDVLWVVNGSSLAEYVELRGRPDVHVLRRASLKDSARVPVVRRGGRVV